MTFSGSLLISKLGEQADPERFKIKLGNLFSFLGTTPSQDLLDFMSYSQRELKYAEISHAESRIQLLNSADPHQNYLKKYLAAKTLSEVPELSPFDENSTYPDSFEAILQEGATGLFHHGIGQFRELRKHCQSILNWARNQPIKNITLIESPLGNILPVQIMRSLLIQSGYNTRIFSLSLPRNDSANRGITYKEVIENSVSHILSGQDLVIYIDDVITGSRFKKIYDALIQNKKRLNNQTPLLPCALIFKPLRTIDFNEENYNLSISSLNKRLKHVKNDLHFNPLCYMPMLPAMKIDDGLPFYFESPVVWGEQPVVAGKKKVNFIFDIIGIFKQYLAEFAAEKSAIRSDLRLAWERDTSGHGYIIPDEIMKNVFVRINSNFDWNIIDRKAREQFVDDYQGVITELSNEQVRERWIWINETISNNTNSKLEIQETTLLSRALREIFALSNIDRRHIVPRDNHYCSYVLEFNHTMKALNRKLVELIMTIKL